MEDRDGPHLLCVTVRLLMEIPASTRLNGWTHPTPNLAAPIIRNATLVTSMSGFSALFGLVQLCRIAVIRRTTRMALRIIGATTPTVRKT